MEDIKVHVVRFKDRPHLQMRYTDSVTGKQVTRSTKVTDQRGAERAAANGKPIYERGGTTDRRG